MITETEAELLISYLILIENDAFLCGEAAGTDQWLGRYHRLQSDQAIVVAFIKSLLPERPVQVD